MCECRMTRYCAGGITRRCVGKHRRVRDDTTVCGETPVCLGWHGTVWEGSHGGVWGNTAVCMCVG